MQDILLQLAERWIGYKTWLIAAVGLTNDAMRVHGSLLILFLSAVVLRRRPDSVWCWLIFLWPNCLTNMQPCAAKHKARRH